MQMRVHHESDLVRPHAAARELVQEARRVVDPVNLSRALRELPSRAGLDHDDVARTVADEQTGHVHRDAIALVGGPFLLPQGFRDDAEHRAAIDPEDAVAEDLDLEATDAHERQYERESSDEQFICEERVMKSEATRRGDGAKQAEPSAKKGEVDV